MLPIVILITSFWVSFTNSFSCFPQDERVLMGNSEFSTSVAIDYFDNEHMALIATVVKILLEEKMGIKAELTKTRYVGQMGKSYLDKLIDGTVDVNLAAYPTFDPIDFPEIRAVGKTGYEETGGWYLPDYLIEKAPELSYYLGLNSVYRYTSLFCPEQNLTTYIDPYEDVHHLLSSSICQQSNITLKESLNCIEQIKLKFYSTKNCALPFLAPPYGYALALDSFILNNLNLTQAINATYIQYEETNETFSVDSILFRFAQNNYRSKKPYMVFLQQPNAAHSPQSNMNLRKVSLPPLSAECISNAYGNQSMLYNCGYQEYSMIKIVRSDLENSHPRAFDFLNRFSMKNTASINEMLYGLMEGNETIEEIACDYVRKNEASWANSIPTEHAFVEVTYSDSLKYSIKAICCVLFSLGLLQIGLLCYYRNNVHVKSGSINFLLLIVIFACVSYCWIFTLFLEPNDFLCMFSIWIETIGYFGVLLGLIMKNIRILIIFRIEFTSRLQRATVKRLADSYLFFYFCCAIAVLVLLLIPWSIIAPTEKVQLNVSTTAKVTYYEILCRSSNPIFRSVYTAFQVILVVIGVVLSISIRNVKSSFNESQLIGAAMYNLFMCLVIQSIVFYYTDASKQIRYLVLSIFSLFAITLEVTLVVSSKLFLAYKGYDRTSSCGFTTSEIPTQLAREPKETIAVPMTQAAKYLVGDEEREEQKKEEKESHLEDNSVLDIASDPDVITIT